MLAQGANSFEGFFAVWAMPNLFAFMMVSVTSGRHEFMAFAAFLRLDDLDLFQDGSRHGLGGRFRRTFHHDYAMRVIRGRGQAYGNCGLHWGGGPRRH